MVPSQLKASNNNDDNPQEEHVIPLRSTSATTQRHTMQILDVLTLDTAPTAQSSASRTESQAIDNMDRKDYMSQFDGALVFVTGSGCSELTDGICC